MVGESRLLQDGPREQFPKLGRHPESIKGAVYVVCGSWNADLSDAAVESRHQVDEDSHAAVFGSGAEVQT